MKKLLLFSLCFYIHHILPAQSGCTDSLAENYNENAMSNDGSCIYASTNYTLMPMATLNGTLEENSGLFMDGDDLWTHADGGNPEKLFRIDSTSGAILQEVTIENATNEDWEDIADNADYVYIGDFGNNGGNRTDLRIYRIAKNELSQTTATAELITFTFGDQIDFSYNYNMNDYDCEAMLFHNDSLHLFSKNWVDNKTRHYVLPATPGNHIAQLKETYAVEGLITGADISDDGVVALIGYTSGGTTFMWVLFDYQDTRFFSGNKRRIELGNALNNSQTEGIVFKNDGFGYISAESISILPARLFSFDTEQWTNPSPTNIRSLNQLSLKIYPNPFQGTITIESSELMQGDFQIKLINTIGQEVWCKENIGNGNEQLTIQVDKKLPIGTYYLQLMNETSIGYYKLVKQ